VFKVIISFSILT